MTQKELHDVVLVATRYNETRIAIDNAIRVLNNLFHIGYYGYDNSNIRNLAYELQKELENASDKFTQNEVIQYFKDNVNE